MKRRTARQEQLAKIYDDEILPLWSERFGRMLMRELTLPPKAMVLDVGCGTGYPALEVLKRMDEQGRIIAIDPTSPMLDKARDKAGVLSGKRIFFRSEGAEPRLSFANDVYDLVVSNLALPEVDDPHLVIAEFARVAKPGGRVIATLPLDGTFTEFYDIFREVLLKRDQSDPIKKLDRYLKRHPAADQATAWFERAGLVDVTVERETFTLLFKSSREFFFAPVIDHGPLSEWKEIAGKGQEMQDTFWHIKEAIDAYFGAKPFQVTVHAGCVRGRKPREGEEVAAPAFAMPSPPDPETEPRQLSGNDDPPTGEIPLPPAVDEDDDDDDDAAF